MPFTPPDGPSACSRISYGRPRPFPRSLAKVSTLNYMYGKVPPKVEPKPALERIVGPDFLEEES